VADRVDAAVNPVQRPRRDAPADCRMIEAGGQELCECDDAVLPRGDPRENGIDRGG